MNFYREELSLVAWLSVSYHGFGVSNVTEPRRGQRPVRPISASRYRAARLEAGGAIAWPCALKWLVPGAWTMLHLERKQLELHYGKQNFKEQEPTR